MIGLPSGTRIYLCAELVDFRTGFDGLTGIVVTSDDESGKLTTPVDAVILYSR